LALLWKLLGNAAYGKTLTRLHNHRETFYCDAAEIANQHNDPLFYGSTKITDGCYEVQKYKKQVEFNLPMQIGLAVYGWAKHKLLKFIYEVLQKYVPKSEYEFLESDTDSIYLAISQDTLKKCIPADRLAEFEEIERLWFVMDPSQNRTPGLLKIEEEGTHFIGLNSKTYVVAKSEDDPDPKKSAKGVQIKRNASMLTFRNFEKVLKREADAQQMAINVGIRPINGVMCTYVQQKNGLSPLYFKRICSPNFRTKPLEI
jgi:hypothetical protein